MNNTIDEFRQAVMVHGITPPDHIEPGQFLRFPGYQKSGNNKAAWCLMFEDMRGGAYGDYSTDLKGTWQASHSAPYTPAELDAHRYRVTVMQAQRDADLLETQQHRLRGVAGGHQAPFFASSMACCAAASMCAGR